VADRAIQKVYLNGTSLVVAIPRWLLHRLQLRPGDFVQVRDDDHGSMIVTPWINRENAPGKGPGRLAPEAPEVPR
jgi:antitoxin component of MazEF toxin-antitoxin module